VNRLAAGAVSGALGTLALDAATYADIAVRGRARSSVPADTVGKTAERTGLDLAGTGDEQTAANRRIGIGALLGYGTGVTIGSLYGILRSAIPRPRLPVAGLALAATAMVGANAGAVAAGTTDPRRWGTEGWLADIVPHVCFGLATAAAFDILEGQRAPAPSQPQRMQRAR
jgi:hypothetical protein